MLYKEFVLKYISIFTLVIGLLSIVINYIIFRYNYRINEDQSFRDLFREFNKRFDGLNESLNEIIGDSFDSRHEKRVIQDYLNLCSEEYLWKKKDRIPKKVWEAWQEGMLNYLNSPKIEAYFEKERKYDKSYYGFINYILSLKSKRKSD